VDDVPADRGGHVADEWHHRSPGSDPVRQRRQGRRAEKDLAAARPHGHGQRPQEGTPDDGIDDLRLVDEDEGK
jgi:hypothetical protein